MEKGKLNVNVSKNKPKNMFGNSYILEEDNDQNQFTNINSQKMHKQLLKDNNNSSQVIQNNSSLSKNNKEAAYIKNNQKQQKNIKKLPNQIFKIHETQNNSNIKRKNLQLQNLQKQLENNNKKQEQQQKLNKKLNFQKVVEKVVQPYQDSDQQGDEDSNQELSKQYQPKKQQNLQMKQEKKSVVLQIKPKKQQQKKIRQIKNSFNQITQSISDLKNNYAKLDANQIMLMISKKQKQKQIKQFLMKKRLQKKQRRKKLNKIKQKEQQQKIQSLQIIQKEKERERQKKLLQVKINQYVQPKKRKEKYREQQKKKNQEVQKYYKKYQNQERLHLKKEKQFQEAVKKQKIKQQQILEQRRMRFRSLDEDELEQHKRRYQQRMQQLQNSKKQARYEQLHKITQDNMIIKDQLWRGPSHDVVDEQLQELQKKKKQPQQKMKKIKKYQEYIKKNFLPKTVQPKSNIKATKIMQTLGSYSGKYNIAPESILQHYDPNKKHVKKYRYFQGRSIGQVLESIPIAKSYSEQKKIGQGYLQHLKSLPKKKLIQQSTQIDALDLEMLNKKFNSIVKVKKRSLPFYQSPLRQNKISISSSPTRQQVKMVVNQLQSQDQKIKSKQKLIRTKKNTSNTYEQQKQVHKDLVRNMERKLQLLAQL